MAGKADRQALKGWGGLSPRYWASALELQDERLVDAHRTLVEAPRDSNEREEAFRRLHLEAHFLLIAFGHMLTCLRVSGEVLGDERIRRIGEDFESRAPWLKDFRDVLEHLDEYTEGRGRLTERGELPEGTGPVLAFGPSERPFEVLVLLGPRKLPLRAAAEAGSRLGHMLAATWENRIGPEEPRVVWGRSK